MNEFIVILRPHQNIKNLFVFMPLFFSSQITDINLLFKTTVAFLAFSLVAGSVYVFNDYHDIEEDKVHPNKRKRPLASGKISKRSAKKLMLSLVICGIGLSFLVDINVLFLVFVYIVINVSYTLKLKHIPILDVFLISTGFVIRLFVGAVVINIELSKWIIIMTFLLALFLAFAKRRDDVLIYLESGKKTRKVVDGYNIEFLNASMMVMSSVIIVSYIMYTISPEVIARINNNKLYLTVVFVILGILRYMHISFVEKNSGSPTEVLLIDKYIQLILLGWVISLILFFY